MVGRFLETPTPTRSSDLAARVAATPAHAEVRAVFLQVVEDALRDEPRAHAAWTSRYARTPRGYAMVPVRDYLARVDAAAALVAPTTSADVAIARLHARAVTFMLDHPGARLFLGPRDREPRVLLERLERSRTLLASYGDWRVQARRGEAVIQVREEWIWLDAVWLPVVRSVFPACGVRDYEVTFTPHGAFSGELRARW